MMPGDPSAPPWEVVNCRCTVVGADAPDGAKALTAAGGEGCRCCAGSGEHACGHECYACDASGQESERATFEGETCEGHHGRLDPCDDGRQGAECEHVPDAPLVLRTRADRLALIQRVALDYVKPPKDADSDGWIDDGLPTMRPNPLDAQDWAPATDEERASLRVPKGWTDVEVNRAPGARLLARGRDSAGRRQGVYSAEHTEAQAAAKFSRMRVLGSTIGALDVGLKERADDDTARCLTLIRKMGLRPGSNADTRAKIKAYGATTLLAEHVVVDMDRPYPVSLRFTGKKGVQIDLPVEDAELAGMLTEQSEGKGPGEPLFQTDERKANALLKELTLPEFKVKDLRTYLANETALDLMSGMEPPVNMTEFRKRRREIAVGVSARLGNTPAMALASYINPAVFVDWESDIRADDFEKGINDV
jgi:DNA topoisomerase-1